MEILVRRKAKCDLRSQFGRRPSAQRRVLPWTQLRNWGQETQKGQEEEGPERLAEAEATCSVHTGRLAGGWAGQGHVSLGTPRGH